MTRIARVSVIADLSSTLIKSGMKKLLLLWFHGFCKVSSIQRTYPPEIKTEKMRGRRNVIRVAVAAIAGAALS